MPVTLPRKPRKQVTITLTANGQLSVSPINVLLNLGTQEVLWRCRGGDAEVRFCPRPNQKAFRGDRFFSVAGGGSLSGAALKTGKYKYVVLAFNSSGIFVAKDLQVEVVDPSTTRSRSTAKTTSRKAAKKSSKKTTSKGAKKSK